MDDFDAIASRLDSNGVRRARLEAREAIEEAESAAALLYLRERTVRDVAAGLMQSGDPVILDTGRNRYHGRIVHAAGDVVTLRSEAGLLVDAHPDRVLIRVTGAEASGGVCVHPGGVRSLWARLLQLEIAGCDVVVETRLHGDPVAGRLRVVGRDHVVLNEQGAEVVVPIAEVVAVVSPA